MLGSKIYSNDPRNSPRFNRANLQSREKLTRYYGRNQEFQEYLNHAIGLVHNLATYNAKVCTSATLRLYRVLESGTSGRLSKLNARSIPDLKMKSIKSGHHGLKAASYAESGAEMVEVVSHPILDLLQSPNPTTPGTFLEHMKWYMCWVGGNGYEYKSKGGDGKPYMLSPMMSQFVSIEASVETGIDRFAYGRSSEVSQYFDPDEVIHYKLYPSPHSSIYGIGAVYGILPHADLIQDSLVHDISMAKNGMHPDGVWILPESTTEPDAVKFEKQLMSKFRGVKDFWKHLIFAGKVEFVSPQFGEKDLMSLPKMEHSEKIIRQGFGHTESMADSTETNVASAIQSFDKQFLGGTIWPALLNDASFKNSQLLADFGLDPAEYFFSYDNPIERDEVILGNRMLSQSNGGIRTVNEARLELGLPESDDEFADKLLINGQPLGSAVADPFAGLLGGLQPKQDQEQEIDRPPKDEQVEPVKSIKSVDPIEAVLKSVRAWKEPLQWRACPSCSKSQNENEMARDEILREAMGGLADDMESVVADLLKDAELAMISAFYLNGITADISTVSRELADQASGELLEVMVPVLEFGGNEMFDQLPKTTVEGSFEITDQRAADFLRDYTVELADDLIGTTADIAKRAVQAGIEQGLTESDVVQLMTDNKISETRATMIARTETQRAVQNGKRQAMIQNGIEKNRWTNAPGASESHQLIAAKVYIPGEPAGVQFIDKPFIKAGESFGKETFKTDVWVPPARPGCRCGIQAVYED